MPQFAVQGVDKMSHSSDALYYTGKNVDHFAVCHRVNINLIHLSTIKNKWSFIYYQILLLSFEKKVSPSKLSNATRIIEPFHICRFVTLWLANISELRWKHMIIYTDSFYRDALRLLLRSSKESIRARKKFIYLIWRIRGYIQWSHLYGWDMPHQSSVPRSPLLSFHCCQI